MLLQVTTVWQKSGQGGLEREDDVTDCPLHRHTRHEQGPTGTKQDGMVGLATVPGSR